MSRRRSRKGRKIRRFLLWLLILTCAAVFLVFFFQLRTVVVSGNRHSKADEITALVLERPTGGNTLLAKLLNTNRKIDRPGFTERINVAITGRDSIRVTVTERSFVGCMEFDGTWWYFDSSGLVMASAASRMEGEGIPPVTGLELTSAPELGAELPITTTKVFSMLGVVRSLTETDAQAVPDEAVFDSNSALTLRYGDVSVKLGSGEKLEMRVKKLAEVLPVLREGYAGVLHLESYDGSQSGLIFDSAK